MISKYRFMRYSFAVISIGFVSGLVFQPFAEIADESASRAPSLYGYMANTIQSEFARNQNGNFDKTTLGDAMILRLKGDWEPEDHLQFHLEAAYTVRYGNLNATIKAMNWGLLPSTESPGPLDDFHQTFEIDHAWALVNIGTLDLKIGKQPVFWGTAYFFNPVDRINSVGALDYITEEKPGVVGIHAGYGIGHHFNISAYITPTDRSRSTKALEKEIDPEYWAFGIRFKQSSIGSFDLSQGIVKEVNHSTPDASNYYAFADVVGYIADVFGVYSECTVRLPASETDRNSFEIEKSIDVAAGLEHDFPFELSSKLEYFYQGSGEKNKANYNIIDLLSSQKVALGKHYVGILTEKPFLEFYNAMIGVISNLGDRSVAGIGEFKWDIKNNLQLSLGGIFTYGETGSEFDGRLIMPTGKIADIIEPLAYLKVKAAF